MGTSDPLHSGQPFDLGTVFSSDVPSGISVGFPGASNGIALFKDLERLSVTKAIILRSAPTSKSVYPSLHLSVWAIAIPDTPAPMMMVFLAAIVR